MTWGALTDTTAFAVRRLYASLVGTRASGSAETETVTATEIIMPGTRHPGRKLIISPNTARRPLLIRSEAKTNVVIRGRILMLLGTNTLTLLLPGTPEILIGRANFQSRLLLLP